MLDRGEEEEELDTQDCVGVIWSHLTDGGIFLAAKENSSNCHQLLIPVLLTSAISPKIAAHFKPTGLAQEKQQI